MPIDLMQEQVEIEEMMHGMTLSRFNEQLAYKRQRGQEGTTPYGVAMIKRAVAPLKKSIEEWMEEAASGGAGRRHAALKYMRQVDPDVMAFLTSKVVLDQITYNQKLQRTALGVGSKIEDEVRWRSFEEQEPHLWKLIQNDHRDADERMKRAYLVRAYNRYIEQWKHWPQSEKIHLGMKLIELFIETTGFAEVSTKYTGNNQTVLYLTATEKVLSWIENNTESAARLCPVHLPMVVEPQPWQGPHGGGYLTHAVRPASFVKTRNKNYLEELSNMGDQLADVYNAVNVVQSVRWQINPGVLEAMKHLWRRGIAAAKLPPHEELPLPPSPFPGRESKTLSEDEKPIFKAWKRKASRIHDYNVKLKSRRMQIGKVIAIAEQFSKYDEIFFPYSLDFRGRMYAMPMFLNPQGSDQAKGLLRFAEGKPLGTERAVGWLAIQGANTWGYDKVSLEDRISWVEERSDEIEKVGNDPASDLWWTKADKPFQFLAFCIEWAGYCRDGLDHVSHLPIALDGSCSGLQHFSAALRDEIGGAAVNLVPQDTPADVYQEVIDRAVELIQRDHFAGELEDKNDLMEACFEFGLSRKTAKRATMTVPYGSTRYSCREFVAEYITEVTEERREEDPSYVSPLTDQEFDASLLLAKYVWDAIGETVIAARTAMDWLREVARILAKEKLPVTWTTPDGFPVIQSYADVKHRRVKTRFGEQLVYLSLAEDDPDKLDSRRQANGVAPNWVHSMDGCHLRQTVNLAYDNGIDAFAVVHDSFGTHASDTDMLGVCLRETFVDLYRGNLLQDFAAEVSPILSGEEGLPALPEMGNLDLEGIKESDFVFA